MAIKKFFAAILVFLLASAGAAIHAENLIFSGSPAAGKNFLCTFTVKKSFNRKMEIRGAENPPAPARAATAVQTKPPPEWQKPAGPAPKRH